MRGVLHAISDAVWSTEALKLLIIKGAISGSIFASELRMIISSLSCVCKHSELAKRAVWEGLFSDGCFAISYSVRPSHPIKFLA